MMKKWLGMFVLFTVLLLPLFAQAEEEKSEGSGSTLDAVVVTATRTGATLDKIGGVSATVLDEEDIVAKQQNTVAELLKGVPGVDITANGGPGTNTSVFLRGADSKNTLVLVDGMMFNDVSDANRGANLGTLTADNIERIEVVRGPSSVLYGSNATAGVINIITKKGKGKPSVYAGAEGGAYNTWKVYGGSSGAVKKFHYSLAAARNSTDGFSIANNENDRIPHAGNTSEDDGWENTTLSGKLGYDITGNFDINATFRFLDSDVDTDDSGAGYAGDRFDGYPSTPNPTGLKERHFQNEQLFGKLNVHNFFLDRAVESNLSYQVSDLERKMYNNDGNKTDQYDGETRDLTWQGDVTIHDSNHLTFGATYYEEEMKKDSSAYPDIPKKDADTTSLFLQDQIFIGEGLDVVAGVRRDDHSKFGGKTTYRIAPAYTIDQTDTTLKASYGTGFRAPSLFELYDPSNGNENLGPEESEGWDVGVEQALLDSTVTCGVTYFDMTFTDRIGWVMTDPGNFSGHYEQTPGETSTNGVETFIAWAPVSSLELLLNYTYNETEDPKGERLKRRPEDKVHFNTRYRFGEKAVLNLDVNWVGERDASDYAFDKNGNQVKTLDAYTVVNISGRYHINKFVEFYGRVDNLFDEFYETAWSYATPGVSAYAGVKVTY